jgi:hypothetical protein
MYAAKQTGKNAYRLFDPAMASPSPHRGGDPTPEHSPSDRGERRGNGPD